MESITSVVNAELCTGCGCCAYICADTISMFDDVDKGRRPRMLSNVPPGPEAIGVCPGIGLAHGPGKSQSQYISELRAAWGPVLGIWEGYSADPELRFSGSSGGAISALALYCLEAGGMEHVLHTAARKDVPYLSETVVSRSREELLRATGSRYAPASPCEGLKSIEDASSPCVFVGKPCDVAAAQKARRFRPRLDANLGVTIGFFCAGTPSTQGTLEMLKRMGVQDPDSLVDLRYRGKGWPGKAVATFESGEGREVREMTYEESWGDVLSKHQQWRCKLCADHTGEFADIAVGDPWYRAIEIDEPGRSLILARTERGRELILAAAEAGYLTITPADPKILPASQRNLLRTRGSLWGRLLACRMMRKPAPAYVNMPLFRHWWRELSFMQKIRSVAGTMKRIAKRRQPSSCAASKVGFPNKEHGGDG